MPRCATLCGIRGDGAGPCAVCRMPPEELSGRYRRSRLEAEVGRLGRAARDAARTVGHVLWATDAERRIAIAAISYETGRRSWAWELRRSPVSVAGTLSGVWESLESVVLTSATLRAGGSFDYMIDSLGLGSVQTSVLGSPFPWIGDNHLLLLTDYLPAPRSRLMEEFKASAAAEIPRLLMLTAGRGLVLMAARARLEFVRDHARPILDAEGIPLLSQGDDAAASLVERMRAETATSLVALRSFWEGVDIPGAALSLLMIEKVPFDSPADPVAGARMEAIEMRGKDPYAEYLVPRAALRFAQGVGRLIRTEEDRGVTVVLDSRLCRAVPYRDAILDSLPGPPRRVRANRAEDAYRLIAEHLGDVELDGRMLERLRAVESADAWAGLADLELSEADARRPDVVATRLERVREMFDFRRWRPGQRETMSRFIEGSDFLAVLPTGSGKSITFQIPALLSPGVTLVVSPLKALMNDQVENLRSRGITKLAAIHSGVGQAEWRDILRGAARGDYRLLYISPERLWSQEFVDALAGIGAARVAVDEAHCISQWGHSFRPEYAAIPDALRRIASGGARPPVLAVTATATESVRRDIVELLALRLPGDAVSLSPGRPEIRYFVEKCSDRADHHPGCQLSQHPRDPGSRPGVVGGTRPGAGQPPARRLGHSGRAGSGRADRAAALVVALLRSTRRGGGDRQEGAGPARRGRAPRSDRGVARRHGGPAPRCGAPGARCLRHESRTQPHQDLRCRRPSASGDSGTAQGPRVPPCDNRRRQSHLGAPDLSGDACRRPTAAAAVRRSYPGHRDADDHVLRQGHHVRASESPEGRLLTGRFRSPRGESSKNVRV